MHICEALLHRQMLGTVLMYFLMANVCEKDGLNPNFEACPGVFLPCCDDKEIPNSQCRCACLIVSLLAGVQCLCAYRWAASVRGALCFHQYKGGGEAGMGGRGALQEHQLISMHTALCAGSSAGVLIT